MEAIFDNILEDGWAMEEISRESSIHQNTPKQPQLISLPTKSQLWKMKRYIYQYVVTW
jgi:hypothetical protein